MSASTKSVESLVSVRSSNCSAPGQQYHQVDIEIGKSSKGRYRVSIVEAWGSNQGYKEEHGRNETVAWAASWDEALAEAVREGEKLEMQKKFLSQARSEAADEMELLDDAAE